MACAGLITAAQRGDLAFVPSAAPRVLERSFGELEFTKAYAGLRELEMANPEVGSTTSACRANCAPNG